MNYLKALWDLLKQTFKEWNEDKVPRHAAALAFFTSLSLAPLLVVVVAIVGVIYGEQAAEGEIVRQFQSAIGQDAASVVQQLIENASQTGSTWISTLVSVVILLVGATGVFGQLQLTLNSIWGVDASEERKAIWAFLRRRLLSFGMILVIGFLLLVSLVISAVISSLDVWLVGMVPNAAEIIQVANFVVSFAMTTLLFALIYKFLPDAYIEWRDVLVGAAVTALLFSLGRWVLGLYLGAGTVTSVYGAAGSFMVILLWVFYSAQIVLFGAEFTQIYARRYGSRLVGPGLSNDDRRPKSATAVEQKETKDKKEDKVEAHA